MRKPVVSKIRVKNPNKSSTKHSNKGNLHYIATRPGVVLVNGVPDMNERQEDNFSKESTEKEYLRYIAKRPRSHGLFGNIDTSNLAKLESEIYELSKNRLVYRGITSLSEEDATELGYYRKEKWEQLLQATVPDIAAQFNIPIDRLNWVGAFHLEQSHPHVHYMFWDSKEHVLSPFIHVSKQNKCREIFSQEIFREEREKAAIEKTVKRDLVLELGEKYLSTNIDLLSSLFMEDPTNKIPGYINNLPVVKAFSEEIQDLIRSLPSHGRIAYGFLPPEGKQKVDAITDRLLTNNLDIRREYLTYLALAETTAKTYSSSAKNYSDADYKIKGAVANADADIRKRVSNLILRHAKQLRAENFSFPANLEEFFQKQEANVQKSVISDEQDTNEAEQSDYSPALPTEAFPDEEPEESSSDLTAPLPQEEYFPYYDEESLFQPIAPKDTVSVSSEPHPDSTDPQYDPVETIPLPPLPPPVSTNFKPHEQTEKNSQTGKSGGNEWTKSILWTSTYKEAKHFLFPRQQQEPDFERAFVMLQGEADKGNALAAYDLGTMYQRGIGREIDQDKANEWFQKSFSLFLKLYEAGTENTNYLSYRLGKMYLAGIGTEQNDWKAVSYLSAAADTNVYAQYTLAGCYLHGNAAVERDPEKAFALYLRSSEKNVYATYELAKLYESGIGTTANPILAEEAYKKAFQKFSEMLRSDPDDKLYYRVGKLIYDGKGTEKSTKKALPYLEKAAELKNPDAQYLYAKILLEHPEDIEKLKFAMMYLQEAADHNNVNALYTLGKLYTDTENKDYDLEKGLRYLEKASEKGNSFAQYRLGKLYETKTLPIYDLDRAVAYYRTAAETGNDFAEVALGKLYLNPELSIRDLNTALQYLSSAAEKGNMGAYGQLGYLYTDKLMSCYTIDEEVKKALQVDSDNTLRNLQEQGLSVYDLEKGISYLKLAADAQDSFAMYRLSKLYLDQSSPLFDEAIGFQYLKDAAAQKNVAAYYTLGKLYTDQTSNYYNLEEGVEYLKKAAEKNPYAKYTLGTLLLNKELPLFDPKTGLRYLTETADCKKSIAVIAQYALGNYYLQEDNEHYNLERGLYYLNKAADAKNSYAEYRLGIFFLKGAGQDRTLGLSYLKSSSDGGNSVALFALGKEYLFGKERDVELGKSYLTQAIQQGNEYAQLLVDSYENMRREQILNGSFQILYSIFQEFVKSNHRQQGIIENFRKVHSKQAAKEIARKLGQRKDVER